MSAWLILRSAWLDFDFALFSFTPSPFLPSSLFVPLLAHRRPSVPAFLSLRHIGADYPWMPRWAGSSIYPSTSTTWTMARRVDARRR